MEVGGILISAAVEEISTHLKTFWDRGQTAIGLLRAELFDDSGDLPIMKFWVQFESNHNFKNV